jgi:SAM-dependent methyltransferase
MIEIVTDKTKSSVQWKTSYMIAQASKYDSVLEIGCSTGKIIAQIKAGTRIGIDACERAISIARSERPRVLYQVCDLNNTELIGIREVECIIGQDIIEHLFKIKARELLRWIETVATKRIILFIPVGYHPQTKDDRGMGNDYYQTHRSTWYPEDMERLGYDVWFYPNWHPRHTKKEKGAMWCEKMLE